MEIADKKAYVEQVLRYLEKDWEWSPILLGLLEKDSLNPENLDYLMTLLDGAIRECRDDLTRSRLLNIQQKLQQMQKDEANAHFYEKDEANALINNLP